MKVFLRTMMVPALVLASPLLFADGAKDCLLEGTVQHGNQAGQDSTTVQIHSISRYDQDSSCNVRRGQKLEFKLPPDTRLKDAPTGSDVKYRYRTDSAGEPETQLISVGA